MKLEFDGALLLSKLKTGDCVAFSEIVHGLTPELFIYAVKLTKSKDDAEDLLQDIFADLWNRREKLEISTSLKSYLYVALKHRFLRKVMRANLNDNALDHLASKMRDIEYTVIDIMAAAEVEDTIAKVVNLLPKHMQNIYVMRGQDYSIKEIAAALGLAEQTVRTYNMQLKHRVKEAILIRHPDVSHSLLWCILSTLTII